MGKFKRLNIDEAHEEFPLLNEETRKALKGGCEFHLFFGDGASHSWEEAIQRAIKGESGQMWVCGAGIVQFDEGGYAALVTPDDEFRVCDKHNAIMNWFDNCDACYYDSLNFCEAHNKYSSNMEECPLCSYKGYVFCGEHLQYHSETQPCYECYEQRMKDNIPDGFQKV